MHESNNTIPSVPVTLSGLLGLVGPGATESSSRSKSNESTKHQNTHALISIHWTRKKPRSGPHTKRTEEGPIAAVRIVRQELEAGPLF